MEGSSYCVHGARVGRWGRQGGMLVQLAHSAHHDRLRTEQSGHSSGEANLPDLCVNKAATVSVSGGAGKQSCRLFPLCVGI